MKVSDIVYVFNVQHLHLQAILVLKLTYSLPFTYFAGCYYTVRKSGLFYAMSFSQEIIKIHKFLRKYIFGLNPFSNSM